MVWNGSAMIHTDSGLVSKWSPDWWIDCSFFSSSYIFSSSAVSSIFPLPSSSPWPAVLGLSCSPSSWNVSPTRCWEELLGACRLIPPPPPPTAPSSLHCHSLLARLNYSPPFLPPLTISYLLISFLSIYHSSIFLFIPHPPRHTSSPPPPPLAVWSGFGSVPSGISKLCSITMECIRPQMSRGHHVPLHSAFYHSSHPSSHSLWSGSGSERRCMCTGQREREMLTRLPTHSCGSVSCLTCEPRSAPRWMEEKTPLALGLGSMLGSLLCSLLGSMLWQRAGSLLSASCTRPRALGEVGPLWSLPALQLFLSRPSSRLIDLWPLRCCGSASCCFTSWPKTYSPLTLYAQLQTNQLRISSWRW